MKQKVVLEAQQCLSVTLVLMGLVRNALKRKHLAETQTLTVIKEHGNKNNAPPLFFTNMF